MYTLGIPDRQKKRTLGYLKQNYINFEEHPSMDGFFDVRFPELDNEGFADIVNRLKQQGVTIIGADSQLTERKIMKLAKLLNEQFNLEDDTSSQGFESDMAKDIIMDLKKMLNTFSTKKYDSPEQRYQEYFDDIQQLVDEYESQMDPGHSGAMSDDDAMKAAMYDAPDRIFERKIREKIRKEINKLLS